MIKTENCIANVFYSVIEAPMPLSYSANDELYEKFCRITVVLTAIAEVLTPEQRAVIAARLDCELVP